MTVEKAVGILRDAGASLTAARRDLRDPQDWRRDVIERLDSALIETEPFRCLHAAWLFTGDGGGRILGGRCGPWAADQLILDKSPEAIVDAAQAEIAENVNRLSDVSPIFGAKLDREIVLENGDALIPASQVPSEWRASGVMDNFVRSPFDPRDCCVLRQDLSVSPAIAVRTSLSERAAVQSVTLPNDEERRTIRARVRAAMLLSCNSAIELPVATRVGPPGRLFAAVGLKTGALGSPTPLPHSVAIDEDKFKRNFEALGRFKSTEALTRAVDRLGRARTSKGLTDVALELGIAAEILLMHGTSSNNTEISYKLASRAAWLLGHTSADRAIAFKAARELYKARSEAVHNGTLSSKSTFDPASSGELVRAAIESVLFRGDFPNWDVLVLGGTEIAYGVQVDAHLRSD